MGKQGKDVMSPHVRRAVAVEGQVIEETVGNYLDGKRMKASTQERVERALVKLGFGELVRKDGAA